MIYVSMCFLPTFQGKYGTRYARLGVSNQDKIKSGAKELEINSN